MESLIIQINNLKLGENSDRQVTKKNRESILFWENMNIRPFRGNSRTLTGTSRMITREDNNLGSLSLLGKLVTRKNRLNNTLEEVIDIDRDLELYCSHQLNLLNPQTL